MVCTNYFGSLIAAWTFTSCKSDSLLGEMDGIIRSIGVAQEMLIKHLQLLGDANDLVDTLQSTSLDLEPQPEGKKDSVLIILASLYVLGQLATYHEPEKFLAHNLARWASHGNMRRLRCFRPYMTHFVIWL